jgi:tetratricopeptide (TPR) repeat protein
MKTITFFSYKGGVGRSLALSNMATRLSEYNKKVCVLDFDLEAPGLQCKFKNYKKSKEIKNGIVDYIHKYSSEGGMMEEKIQNYSITLNPGTNLFQPIQFIPAGDIEKLDYWRKLSTINWSDMFYNENGQGVKFFLNLKAKIEKEFSPDFLLIDSRTGFTDISGITLRLLADEVVILAVNNEENLWGSKKIIKSLLNTENSLFGKSPKINFVLTRLPYKDVPKDREKEFIVVEKIKKEFKTHLNISEFDISVIHSDRRLEENERLLIGEEYEEKEVSISNDYLKLFDKITVGALTVNDVNKFKNKNEAQKEYIKALAEKDSTKKLSYLNKAIELDNTKYNYYWARGYEYTILENRKQALEDYKSALILNSNSAELLCNIGSVHYELNEYKDAIKYLDKALELNPKYENALLTKAQVLRKDGQCKDSITVLNNLLENINPNSHAALNTRADGYRFLKEYQKAYADIYKAIEINSDESVYFGTLAEIYSVDNKIEEFYLNLTIALSKGITAKSLSTAKDVYEKFKTEERFIALMSKYGIDIEEIFQ